MREVFLLAPFWAHSSELFPLYLANAFRGSSVHSYTDAAIECAKTKIILHQPHDPDTRDVTMFEMKHMQLDINYIAIAFWWSNNSVLATLKTRYLINQSSSDESVL